MKKHLINLVLLIFISSVVFFGCNQSKKEIITSTKAQIEEAKTKASLFFKPLPSTSDNPENPSNADKIALGKMLYFDVRLSKNQTQSCNTCHNLETFGVDNLPTSPGDAGTLGSRNSPTVLNSSLQFVQFWDGRSKDVEDQAGGPIVNPVEMAMDSHDFTVERIKSIPEYKELFAKAFAGEENPYTYLNITRAIGSFERTLLTPSRFDDYLNGNKEALTEKEFSGMAQFINNGCTTCHSGVLLGGNSYQKFGVMGDYWTETKSKNIDLGRFDVTKNEADKYFFKTSQLRNIEKTAPYFHDGSIATLEEAIKIMAKIQLGKDLKKQEIDDIVAFLKTLTGEVPKSALQAKTVAAK